MNVGAGELKAFGVVGYNLALPVPEPACSLLLAVGAGCEMWLGRRRAAG